MTDQTQIRQTIVQLLSNMSDGKEIRSYLQRFSSVDQARFAVIKIGGAILQDQLEKTAAALAFLHTVGLTPIVLHGGGPQLDVRLKQANIETPKIDGLRVTNEAALDVARDVFIGENIKLVEAVRAQGVAAHSVSAGVLEAKYLDKEKYGLVGVPTKVRLGLIQSIAQSGAIPILTCLGVAPGGQLLNINGDNATSALIEALQPMKIVFLSGTGGMLKPDGSLLSSINLASDYEGLIKSDWVHSGMALKLKVIKGLLDAAPLSSSVSITSPSGLVRELFTHGGSGTLVRRGERLEKITDKSKLDEKKLTKLIEQAFARKLESDWYGDLQLEAAFLSESYRAGAIVTRVDNQFTYLDKFAVIEEARGEGLARVVWRAMIADYPSLFWRSRTANGFNAFYNDNADGSLKTGPWTIYWKGDESFARLEKITGKIAAMPMTLSEQALQNGEQ